MSTTPLRSTPSAQQRLRRPRPNARPGAILPVPGNAEIAVWSIVEIVLAIVAAASDGVQRARLGHRDDRG